MSQKLISYLGENRTGILTISCYTYCIYQYECINVRWSRIVIISTVRFTPFFNISFSSFFIVCPLLSLNLSAHSYYGAICHKLSSIAKCLKSIFFHSWRLFIIYKLGVIHVISDSLRQSASRCLPSVTDTCSAQFIVFLPHYKDIEHEYNSIVYYLVLE